MTNRGNARSGTALGGEPALQRHGTAASRTAASRRRDRLGLGAAVTVGLLVVATIGSASDRVYSFRDRRGTVHFTNVPTDSRFRAMPAGPVRSIKISYSGRSAFARSGGRLLAGAERLWSEPPADLGKLIDDTARRYGVEPALVHAVVRAESDFDHLAVSSSGAQGLMQLMPGTAQEVGVRDAFHPKQNLEGGVYYLRSLLDRFNGNTQLAVAGYNAGPGAVERFGGVPPYAETIEYLERVFRFRQEYLLSQRARQRMLVASR